MISIYLALLDDADERDRFERIYKKYKNKMSNIAFAILKDEHIVFEAVDSALMSIAKNIKKLPPESNPDYERSYIFMIVRNFAIDLSRRMNVYNAPTNIDLLEIGSSEYAPDNLSISKQEMERLFSAIHQLPDATRLAITLKYVYGFKVEEVANGLGITTNTAKIRIHRGIKALRAILKEEIAKGGV